MTKSFFMSRRQLLEFSGLYAWMLVLASCSKGFRYDNSASEAYRNSKFDDGTLFEDLTYYV